MKREKEGVIAGCLKAIDFYKDLPKGLAQPTYVGATCSTGFLVLMGVLIFYQIGEFYSYQKQSEMLIDTAQEDQFFYLNIDLILPKAPCAILALDVVDVTGVHIVGIEGRLHKHSLDPNGKVKGVTDAIQQQYADRNPDVVFEQAKKQLDANEGCQLEGHVKLHKVPGNFHLSSHDCPETVMKLMHSGYRINFTHQIKHLSFGMLEDQVVINRRYGGSITNELSGTEFEQNIPFGSLMVNYYLDISEEEYSDMTYTMKAQEVQSGKWVDVVPKFIGYSYRSMKQIMITNMLPTLVWNVSITPIKAHFTMSKETVSDFLVRLCGIVGGIFAAATIAESIFRNGLCLVLPDFSDNDDDDANKPSAAPRARAGAAQVASAAAAGPSETVQMVSQESGAADTTV